MCQLWGAGAVPPWGVAGGFGRRQTPNTGSRWKLHSCPFVIAHVALVARAGAGNMARIGTPRGNFRAR
eukprot:12380973-Alexandrium_andersonii.AAC.1